MACVESVATGSEPVRVAVEDGRGPWRGELDPQSRLAGSGRKIQPPFELDPTLCFYSPQDNVDALSHPRVVGHHRWLCDTWTPQRAAQRQVALLFPCTAIKPYPVSPEHRALNGALLDAGWKPRSQAGEPPSQLHEALGSNESEGLLRTAPLLRGDTAIHRIVLSEPLAMVPYEAIYGPDSPSTAYDDPGLFEWRGTSVAPWRADYSGSYNGDGTWAWGPEEHSSYAEAHNSLVTIIAEVLGRVSSSFERIVAWLPAGLTHRSFIGDDSTRRAEGLPVDPVGPHGPISLAGVSDLCPGLVDMPESDPDPAALVDHLDEILGKA